MFMKILEPVICNDCVTDVNDAEPYTVKSLVITIEPLTIFCPIVVCDPDTIILPVNVYEPVKFLLLYHTEPLLTNKSP